MSLLLSKMILESQIFRAETYLDILKMGAICAQNDKF